MPPQMQFSASPWRVLDAEKQKIVRDVVALRQKFAGKIVSLAKESGRTGEPMLRNLEYNFPNMGYAGVSDQFMMGDDLLVAPVVEKGATSRKVVLPPGKWKADDGEVYAGPATIEISAPLSRLPHFLRQTRIVALKHEFPIKNFAKSYITTPRWRATRMSRSESCRGSCRAPGEHP